MGYLVLTILRYTFGKKLFGADGGNSSNSFNSVGFAEDPNYSSYSKTFGSGQKAHRKEISNEKFPSVLDQVLVWFFEPAIFTELLQFDLIKTLEVLELLFVNPCYETLMTNARGFLSLKQEISERECDEALINKMKTLCFGNKVTFLNTKSF